MIASAAGHQLGVYGGWRAGSDVAGRPLEVLAPDDRAIRTSTAYGTPREVVDYLRPLAAVLARYPVAHLVLRLHYPGMEAAPAARAIELLAREVAPALR
jgi:hypothetical protein